MNEDLKIALQVLSFYGNKGNWELYQIDMGLSSKINDDGGQLARITKNMILTSIQRKTNPEPNLTTCWLTEDIAYVAGYLMIELNDKAYIYQYRNKFMNRDMILIESYPEAVKKPFINKFLALLSLSKHLERQNKQSQLLGGSQNESNDKL